jgi:hypothetical protein
MGNPRDGYRANRDIHHWREVDADRSSRRLNEMPDCVRLRRDVVASDPDVLANVVGASLSAA